jgi:protein-disulfide isomerase
MSWNTGRVASATLFALMLVATGAAAQGAASDSLLSRANQSRTRGEVSAPITIIELADFQCPYCRQFSQETFAALDSAYIRTGKARIVFYNLPFPNHPSAWIASEAAMCAGAQGSFWPMHDRLFAEQAKWTDSPDPVPQFEGFASGLGLDLASFRDCTAKDRVAPLLVADLLQAGAGGANATPTFVILRKPKPGEDPEAAQRTLSGPPPLADFAKAIDELSK